jgi:hypothetical protein
VAVTVRRVTVIAEPDLFKRLEDAAAKRDTSVATQALRLIRIGLEADERLRDDLRRSLQNNPSIL